MNQQEATEEAKRRWGAEGEAVIDRRAEAAGLQCLVGFFAWSEATGKVYRVRGTGATWEEAFTLADKIEASVGDRL